MTRKIMAALASSLNPSPQYTVPTDYPPHGSVVEEIEGLIRVHKDGYVERPQVVPCVTISTLSPELNVTSRDMVIDSVTNTWARVYVPICQHKLPLLVYFHGGGFCVGSAAWSCYHAFLARLSSKVGCVIMSVNYRLAPENPLPAPYDEGLKALMWVKQQMLHQQHNKASELWWTTKCNFSSVFLAGDSAGANIAYNVATRLGACDGAALSPLNLKGLILIQPFFGGEARTGSEKCMAQSPGSALNLAASDTYWRLALPCGANRDHPWCNPLAVKLEELKLLRTLVCVSEMDILKDRNLEFCEALARAGKRVEYGVFKGVGHAFQILSKSQLAKNRAEEMMARVKSFMGL
ncbi:carboxylesterase 6 [Spatholobus suberectus]|nr:carboxylesterase 6 [Spatholobus suberectus]